MKFSLGDLILEIHVTACGSPTHPSHHPVCRAAFEKRTMNDVSVQHEM